MNSNAVMQARLARRGLREGLVGLLLALAVFLLVPSAAIAAKTVKVKVALTAAEDLNPDYQGRPSPVNVIVFQLTSADAFTSGDFFSLFDPDAAALGGDMLSRTQMLLQPGEVREWEADFEKETRFIGVVAAFRDIENAQWRSIVELPEKGLISRFFKKNKLRITVDSLAVSVTTKK
jgi:type VI secretion system protein VasD